jgi:putative glycosyltransferase (TIGR04372 family)
VALLSKRPTLRFSSKFSDKLPRRSAEILLRIGAFREGIVVMTRTGAATRSPIGGLIMSKLLFELAEFDHALAALALWHAPTELVYLKGLLELVVGDERRGVRPLCLAAAQDPPLMRPHQNLSARSPRAYIPNDLDVAAGALGRLYDAYNYVGQRVTHVGAGYLGIGLYGGALRAQQKLRHDWPDLSAELRIALADLGISLDDLRVLPVEWVTQVGHLGMMDILFRMRDLGWWKGQALVLAPQASIANDAMLSLFEDRCQIFASTSATGSALFDEISSLQRYCGMSFNAFELPTGELVPWQEAGAIAIRQWEAEGRGYPLRDEFDRRFGSDSQILAAMEKAKKYWGLDAKDWYVCLHIRDASHYGEMKGTGQSHRNAEIASYLPLIEHVTGQGGWVIKLGGPNSPKFPKMKRLIDYARSPFKSSAMDLHLIRHARYFVGTTSGLTNVAISFGVPSALMNCITVDAQLWGDRVRFALKPVMTQHGSMLTQRQITSSPWRWRLFGAEVMLRHGLIALESTPEEVLETAKEVEDLANQIAGQRGEIPFAPPGPVDLDGLIEAWRGCLGLPHFYGNARPSLYYLHKHRSEFLQD